MINEILSLSTPEVLMDLAIACWIAAAVVTLRDLLQKRTTQTEP